MSVQKNTSIADDKKLITDYMKKHNLEDVISTLINDLVRERPDDPFVDFSQTMEAKSPLSNIIIAVRGREILGSDGLPALEGEVETLRGTFRSIITNLGPFDNDSTRYDGKGLLASVKAINTTLSDALINQDPTQQESIDYLLSSEAITPANAILCLSIAVCKAAAKYYEIPLYQHISNLANIKEGRIPMPWFNLVNGGNKGENDMYAQGVMISPSEARNFEEALSVASCLYRKFPEAFATATKTTKPNTGKLGGYATQTERMEDILSSIVTTANENDLVGKIKISINMNVSQYVTSPVVENEGDETYVQTFNYELSKYVPEPIKSEVVEPVVPVKKGKGSKSQPVEVVPEVVKRNVKSSGEMVDMYNEWLTSFPLISIEDPFDKKDSASLLNLKEKIAGEISRSKETPSPEDGVAPPSPFPAVLVSGDVIQMTGNECIVSLEDLNRADEKQTYTTCVLTLSKSNTVTNLIALNAKAESLGIPVIAVSDGDGESANEIFMSHAAVGLRCSQFRGGGLMGGFVEKYNELLRISLEEDSPVYIGAGGYRK